MSYDDTFSEYDKASVAGVIAAHTSLDHLIAGLKAGLSREIAEGCVESQLGAWQIDDAELAQYVNFQSSAYTRNIVYRDARFEVLILCWSAGAVSPIHDHGGSRCFFKVQRGSLLVDEYSLVAGGREPGCAQIARSGTRTLREADVDVRSAEHDIHRVAAFGGNAISLHVYAKALDRCLVFDTAAESCRFEVSRYHNRA